MGHVGFEYDTLVRAHNPLSASPCAKVQRGHLSMPAGEKEKKPPFECGSDCP